MPIRERASRVALEPFPQDIRTRLLNAPMPSQEGIQAAAEVFGLYEDQYAKQLHELKAKREWRTATFPRRVAGIIVSPLVHAFATPLKKKIDDYVQVFTSYRDIRVGLESIASVPQDNQQTLPQELIRARRAALTFVLTDINWIRNRNVADDPSAQIKTYAPVTASERKGTALQALDWITVLQNLTPASEYELNVQLFDLQHRFGAVRDGAKIDQASEFQSLGEELAVEFRNIFGRFSRRRNK